MAARLTAKKLPPLRPGVKLSAVKLTEVPGVEVGESC